MIENKSIYYCTKVKDVSHQCEYHNTSDNSCMFPHIKSCQYQKLKLNADLISWEVDLVEHFRMEEIKSRIACRINKHQTLNPYKLIYSGSLSLYKIRYYQRKNPKCIVSVVITFKYSIDCETHRYVLTPIHITRHGDIFYDVSKNIHTVDDVDKEYLVYDNYFKTLPEFE